MRSLPACLFALLAGFAQAQQPSEIPQGLRDATPRWHALTGARLVLAPGQVVENGTLVMKDGVIVAVGAGVKPPAGAKVWQLAGRTVYAGFIDAASSLGQGRVEPPRGQGLTPGRRWVRSEYRQAAALDLRPDDLRAAREQGFTTALSLPPAGAVFRGQSALISLRDHADARGLVLAADVAQHLAHEYNSFDFEAGARPTALGYPTSLMGSIALERQTLLNARWAAGPAPAGERREFNAGLAALAPALGGRQPVIHEALDEEDLARIASLRDEFGLKVIAQGTGHEYRKATQLKALGLPVILPLAYPAAPEVEQPESALDVPLQLLQHWERAPGNAAALQAAGVEFAISTQGLKDLRKEFWPRLRQAVQRGLPPEAALAALTTTPARLLGQPRLGRLAPGQLAHVVVASADLFTSEQAEIEIAFVDGQPLPTEAWERFDVRGRWAVTPAGGAEQSWQFDGTRAKPTLRVDGKACELQQRGRELLLRWPCDGGASLRLEGRGQVLSGALTLADGRTQAWTAKRVAPFDPPAPQPAPAAAPSPATFPAGVFGRVSPPDRPAAVLVRNASLWTSAAAGRLEATDLLVRDGRIAAIGKGLTAPAGAVVIDAAGKHLTPGLIDAHSHTAIHRGINEFAHSVTAEVRVADVIDPTDISLYRQLAGGVTSANLLHGSANAIGGQNQVIKLRWGQDAEALKFAGARPGIKFALGENVKRANFPAVDGDPRYPATRMGVEQVMRDAFLAAQRYREQRKADPNTRRDLQMETLVELLEKQRVIHIHSYRADEILMFAALAREFGLEVATFQHVLEAYKVAPEIAALGAGASGFSDWWGYKVEVQDAIPYNGAMTQKAGVLTSFNSDSDELARRLNTEAAKALRYGGKAWGMSEVEALKLVTLNPARQLRIDQRVGSLEVGKDADFVIWSAHPLSSTAKAEQTWIDGRRYFDLGEDARLRERDRTERARLVALALPERAKAAAPPEGRPPTPLAAALDQLELQRWLHQMNRDRQSYFGGDAWHECTQDMF
ncbi:amidohydrolase family protein [Roseateles sp.]|uniref:amidohydrolase family protein n=1 Tax=Roseateles sp. TaxID=1971397 RepID=UPI0025DE191E|nr:amidohydrolase family protein [Roseateles sp.]MBV8035787.1 amidohydrolase family protein [Roseateles sp.]